MIWAAELVIGDPAVAPGFIPIFAVHERNRPPRPAASWLLDHRDCCWRFEHSARIAYCKQGRKLFATDPSMARSVIVA
jgi:hypothetical protein